MSRRSIDAPIAHARRLAIAQLCPPVAACRKTALAGRSGVLNALRRWFAVLFWFLLLGPVGALLYRLLALLGGGPDALAGQRGSASPVRAWCWPAGVAGGAADDAVDGAGRQFRYGVQGLARGARQQWSASTRFLGAVARASVSAELREEAHDYSDAEAWCRSWRRLPELRDAMSLVWRMLLLWMAVLALLVIAGWVT